LGIIPDGNRRWARERGLPTFEGHRQGLETAKEVAREVFDRGVKYLTMYAFSTENWKRTSDEVGYLMELFYGWLATGFGDLEERGVRFRLLGSRHGLSAKLVRVIDELEAKTAGLTGGTLALCLNYGGQVELTDAVRAVVAAGTRPEEVTPELIGQYLYAPELPPVDLIIRTSGERRSSGFMLWRAAYDEYYFADKNWPDFGAADLGAALEDYSERQRRFGK
jgi:undecaprenyl diphosphate synthase